MKKKKFHGKAVYQPNGKAEEYSKWACNLYNGCTNSCDYCFNNKGLFANVVGGNEVTLKKSLMDESKAQKIFKKELNKNRDKIIKDGGVHHNFVSDPCLPQTIELNWACIDYALSQGVPVQVLTKRADWLCHPAVQNALANNNGLLSVGFSLTGHDEREPFASPTSERIQSMKALHDAGIRTWASMEPIITPQTTYEIIVAIKDFCDYFKIGVMSGTKNYTPDDIKQLITLVNALGLPQVYWKDSLLKFIQ